MSPECLICLEIINNKSSENMDLWICNNCNVEIHTHCKNQWDIANEKENTCPHCRIIEHTRLVIFDQPVSYNINENIVSGVSRQCLYCKLISIFIFGISFSSIFILLLYLVLNDYHFQYNNYTRLNY